MTCNKYPHSNISLYSTTKFLQNLFAGIGSRLSLRRLCLAKKMPVLWCLERLEVKPVYTLLSITALLSIMIVLSGCGDDCETQCQQEYPFDWERCECDIFGPYLPGSRTAVLKRVVSKPRIIYIPLDETTGTCSKIFPQQAVQLRSQRFLLFPRTRQVGMTGSSRTFKVVRLRSSRRSIRINSVLDLAGSCEVSIKGLLQKVGEKKVYSTDIDVAVTCGGIPVCSEMVGGKSFE